MNDRILELRQRRGELLARIAVQRGQLIEMSARCEGPLAWVDQGMAVVRFLRAKPLLVAGVAALLVIRRRGVMGLVRTGWKMWKGYRFFTAMSGKLSGRE
ncbi:MAG TPA: YqjK-like family protein [Gallionella sp.]|nr:YqjK-like family protein [Gallionella sp.]